MADSIDEKYGVKADLVASSGGRFEVYKDDVLIYSKLKTGRFPENEEILEKLDKESSKNGKKESS